MTYIFMHMGIKKKLVGQSWRMRLESLRNTDNGVSNRMEQDKIVKAFICSAKMSLQTPGKICMEK